MQFALMIYHSPEEFEMRKNDYSDPRLGAWRAYYKALVEAGVAPTCCPAASALFLLTVQRKK